MEEITMIWTWLVETAKDIFGPAAVGAFGMIVIQIVTLLISPFYLLWGSITGKGYWMR